MRQVPQGLPVLLEAAGQHDDEVELQRRRQQHLTRADQHALGQRVAQRALLVDLEQRQAQGVLRDEPVALVVDQQAGFDLTQRRPRALEQVGIDLVGEEPESGIDHTAL